MPMTSGGNDEMERIADLAARRAGGKVDELLELACDALGLDAAYVTEFKGDEQVYRSLAGDAESFGLARDDGYPLEGSYCQRMVLGKIPSVVPDVSANEEVAHLALTALGEIGAYVGVPVTLSDGRIWGTLCAVGHQADDGLGSRAQAFMQVLARLAAAEIELEIGVSQRAALERRVAELEAELTHDARAAVVEGVTRATGIDGAGTSA